MDMGTRARWIVLGTVLPALALVAAAGRAEDAAGDSHPPWRFDVRVVRLEAPAPVVEKAPALPGQQADGTLAASWEEVLAALKERGKTQIVMDRSATGLVGVPTSVSQSHVENVMVQVRSDGEKTYTEARPFTRGATVKWALAGDANSFRMDYDATLEWSGAERAGSSMAKWDWRGSYRLGATGRMLALRHAEQDGKGGGVEVYVLIEGRPVL
jgi:hypothetical protein